MFDNMISFKIVLAMIQNKMTNSMTILNFFNVIHAIIIPYNLECTPNILTIKYVNKVFCL